jgi:nucleoid DNA-binding protein
MKRPKVTLREALIRRYGLKEGDQLSAAAIDIFTIIGWELGRGIDVHVNEFGCFAVDETMKPVPLPSGGSQIVNCICISFQPSQTLKTRISESRKG